MCHFSIIHWRLNHRWDDLVSISARASDMILIQTLAGSRRVDCDTNKRTMQLPSVAPPRLLRHSLTQSERWWEWLQQHCDKQFYRMHVIFNIWWADPGVSVNIIQNKPELHRSSPFNSTSTPSRYICWYWAWNGSNSSGWFLLLRGGSNRDRTWIISSHKFFWLLL